MKLAVVSDLHFSQQNKRQGYVEDLGDIFMLKVIQHLNRYIKPDLLFIAGDLLNDADNASAPEQLRRLKESIDKAHYPVIVIPGNHDPKPEIFYQVFPPPPEAFDCQGIRFIPFCNDQEVPNYNAERSTAALDKKCRLADEFDGPSVSLQHVPLFAPDTNPSPYNYRNAADIVDAMRQHGIVLTISGHYHAGHTVVNQNITPAAIIAPAYGKAPFQFLEIEIDNQGQAAVTTHRMQLPDSLPAITDFHIHTPFAYCNENMDMAKTLRLAEMTGLGRVTFSEHAAHLYLSASDYSSSAYFVNGLAGCNIINRMPQFLRATQELQGEFLTGLELDCDCQGRFTVYPDDLKQVDIRIGALHTMHCKDFTDENAVKEEFLYRTQQILDRNVHILAHPFRIFRRHNLPRPPELYSTIADMLKASDTAAEINFHCNDPDPEFVRCCLQQGVKISFGSDSHNLYEVGAFSPQIELLRQIDYLDRLEAVLFNPE